MKFINLKLLPLFAIFLSSSVCLYAQKGIKTILETPQTSKAAAAAKKITAPVPLIKQSGEVTQILNAAKTEKDPKRIEFLQKNAKQNPSYFLSQPYTEEKLEAAKTYKALKDALGYKITEKTPIKEQYYYHAAEIWEKERTLVKP